MSPQRHITLRKSLTLFYSTQSQISHQINRLKSSFSQVDGLPFKDILSSDLLQVIAETTGSYRDKVYHPLTTLLVFVFQTLSADHSCKDTVARVLADRLSQGLPSCSVNTGPYCKARQRLSLNIMIRAVCETGMQLHRQAKENWRWYGFSVLIIDGTTLQMADTQLNQEKFPQSNSQKKGVGFPIARMVALISLSCGTVVDFALAPCKGKLTGELSLFSKMLGSLSKRDLILADRYYCTFGLIALLQQRGVPAVFKNHAQRKCDFRRGKNWARRIT